MAASRTRTRTRIRARSAAPAGAALLALLAGTAGCGSPVPQPQPGPGPSRAGVQRILDRRADALLHRDEAGFLADTAPGSGFRTRELQVFRNLAGVPLGAWTYEVERLGPGPRPTARVLFGYRLKGYDRTSLTSEGDMTLGWRDGRWYVTDERYPARELWDQGPVRVVRGAHSLVLGTTDRAALRGYAAIADRAVPAVRSVWADGAGRPAPAIPAWTGTVVVEVPSSIGRMAELLASTPGAYQNIAAVTTGESGDSVDVPVDRVIVNPAAFADLSAFGRQVVITHETTHVATGVATTVATPLWLSEGFADWVSYRTAGRTPRQIAPELARDVAAGRIPASLPADEDFATTRSGLPQAYEGAWLACRMIADRWGTDALVRLYRAAGAEGTTPDRALRATLGVGLNDFTARWRDYVQRELR